jgi:hypothetical protein
MVWRTLEDLLAVAVVAVCISSVFALPLLLARWPAANRAVDFLGAVLWRVFKYGLAALFVLVCVLTVTAVGGVIVGSIGTVPALILFGLWVIHSEGRKTREEIRRARQ